MYVGTLYGNKNNQNNPELLTTSEEKLELRTQLFLPEYPRSGLYNITFCVIVVLTLNNITFRGILYFA